MTIAEKIALADTIIAAVGVIVTAVIGFLGLRTLRLAPWARSGNTDPIPDLKLRRWFGTQAEYDALLQAGNIDPGVLYGIVPENAKPQPAKK